VLDSKNLKFVETMSNAECEVSDKSQKLMDLVIKHAFIDIDVIDVAGATRNVNLRQSSREWLVQLQNTSIPLETRALAAKKLNILSQAGLYKNSPLGKDILQEAKKQVFEFSFQATAVTCGQNISFAEKM
jgi:hypothetical protein